MKKLNVEKETREKYKIAAKRRLVISENQIIKIKDKVI